MQWMTHATERGSSYSHNWPQTQNSTEPKRQPLPVYSPQQSSILLITQVLHYGMTSAKSLLFLSLLHCRKEWGCPRSKLSKEVGLWDPQQVQTLV